jgi:hypothetical protein
LAIQNLVASLCCALLAAFFWFDDTSSWPALLLDALPVVAILLAVIANLASVGYQIAVEKDWIVVISDNDNDVLAKMNSVFRTIDLLCLLIAPSLAGSKCFKCRHLFIALVTSIERFKIWKKMSNRPGIVKTLDQVDNL